MSHYTDDDLVLYFYGEGRSRTAIARHLDDCPACATNYRAIAGTLEMIAVPEPPERGDQYGLEVWQRIRHKLPEQQSPWLMSWLRWDRLTWAAAAAVLVLAAFVAGRAWPRAGRVTPPPIEAASGSTTAARQRILLTSVADHLDRSERVLTDIMNATDRTDISTEQRWADDLLSTSRLYRQDAEDSGEQSVAAVLDDLERSLLEIVHSPSPISAAELDQVRRRIDAAALLFKVRVLSDELRQREDGPATATSPRTSTRRIS